MIKLKRLNNQAVIPTRQHPHDAGLDLYAIESVVVKPNYVVRVPIGWACELPIGWELQIRSKSGLALEGIIVANAPGTVDSNYRKEIHVLLTNIGLNAYVVNKYDCVAQAVLSRVELIEPIIID